MLINVSKVKKKIADEGKQASQGFLRELDVILDQIIMSSCEQFNGGRKRIDSSLIPKKYKR